MEGVTTALVAFIFLGLAIPSLIKSKNQYYVALFAVVVIILLDTVAHMVPASTPSPTPEQGGGVVYSGFRAFCYVAVGFAQIIALIALFLSTGGITFRQLHGDMIEVIRRGETEKEVIIPLPESIKRKAEMQNTAPKRSGREPGEPQVYKIDETPASPPPAPKPADNRGPLPLD